ncbi:MAG TPA: SAM-dependent methyltransferase [Treponemataceae bacterium]|nr:SAM-dependent methyltransferase [Treponemataceae bacterium]HPS43671.1 SAM-dependent methyltransferase [Treponemataceae bacterium]
MGKKPSLSGAEAFEAYYQERFADRWPALRAALLAPSRQVTLPPPILKPYWLDAASLEAALALPSVDSGAALDLCAAPGGKTLALASRLGEGSTLTANELSRDRRARLIAVLDQHLGDSLRARVSVTGYDGARWSRYEKGAFDRILLDAPCSSERHVLSSPAYLAEWSPARVKNLAQRQWALLSGSWLVLKSGGFLVYSTCALSEMENDGVVERLIKKYPDAAAVPPDFSLTEPGYESMGESTRYGTHILPDRASGAGPIYYALIRKADS